MIMGTSMMPMPPKSSLNFNERFFIWKPPFAADKEKMASPDREIAAVIRKGESGKKSARRLEK
jgi:hypothetical protein